MGHQHNLTLAAMRVVQDILHDTCLKLCQADEQQVEGGEERWTHYDNAFWDIEERCGIAVYG